MGTTTRWICGPVETAPRLVSLPSLGHCDGLVPTVVFGPVFSWSAIASFVSVLKTPAGISKLMVDARLASVDAAAGAASTA